MEEQVTSSVQTDVSAGMPMEQEASWLAGEDGSFAEKWYEKAPQGYRIPDGLKTAKSVWDIIKMADNAQRKLGYPPDALLPKPLPTWKEEQWKDFFSKIGVPQDISDYGLQPAEGDNQDVVKAFLAEAQNLGLLPNQVKGIYNFYRQLTEQGAQEIQKSIAAEQQEAENALKRDFGSKYQERLEKAKSFFEHYCPEDVKDQLRSKYGNDPIFIKFLASAAELVKDDSLLAQKAGSPANSANVALQQELNEIERNPIFYDPREAQKYKKEHDWLVKRAYQLRTALSQS